MALLCLELKHTVCLCPLFQNTSNGSQEVSPDVANRPPQDVAWEGSRRSRAVDIRVPVPTLCQCRKWIRDREGKAVSELVMSTPDSYYKWGGWRGFPPKVMIHTRRAHTPIHQPGVYKRVPLYCRPQGIVFGQTIPQQIAKEILCEAKFYFADA